MFYKEKLKKRMEELDMLQIDLCRKSGVQPGHLCRIYNGGIIYPRQKVVAKIAQALDVNESYFYSNEP